jgi:alpha-glucosidase
MTATSPAETVTATGLGEPHHDGSELYVERGETSAVLRLRAQDGAAKQVHLRYVIDGEPRTARASVDSRADGETWWKAELPLATPVIGYRWLLTGGSAGYRWVNGRGSQPHEVPGSDDFKLLARPGGPDWHLSSVVYEIFPDRFASSGAEYEAPAWAVRRDWDRPVEGKSRNTSREWYGGDLPGIEQRLDWIESLGANVLYLTPIFPAGSTHRYDATSFDRVDPLLGGDEAFASLARAVHARGMRLVGDLTLNHCGAGHEWFVRAQADPASPEHSFFFFDPTEKHGYFSWLGVKSLPVFDWRSEALHGRMATVLRKWLDAGLDGWRIDVANMVGRRRDLDVNAAVARWTRSLVDDTLLIAEHGHDFRPDLDGLGWQGTMNYAGFLRPAWWWLRRGAVGNDDFDVFTSTPAPSYAGPEAVAVMRAFRAGVPWETALHSWALLDSHDTPRFGGVAGSSERQIVGIGLQMTTPGVPMLFAGDELGLGGAWGEDARRTMPWDHPERWDENLLREYRTLIALRRSSPALARGGIRYAHVGDDAVAYLRETKDERLLCLAARAPHDPIAIPFTQLETLYGSDARDGVLPAHGPAFHVWRIENG